MDSSIINIPGLAKGDSALICHLVNILFNPPSTHKAPPLQALILVLLRLIVIITPRSPCGPATS